MATRRDAREWALQILFQRDVNPSNSLETTFRYFWSERKFDAVARKFAETLVCGVIENREQLDEMIKKYAEHWDIARMGIVERNVMRMALWEMLYKAETPAVVINEAVDIAKYFSTNESGRFVNAILDCIRKDMPRET